LNYVWVVELPFYSALLRFAQIAQNSFRFMLKNSEKNISGFAQNNCAKLISFHSQKLRKSSQKYGHFVETLTINNIIIED